MPITSHESFESLQAPELKARLQELRRTDNFTNWFYFLRLYLYLGMVLGIAVWFLESVAQAGWSWWWTVPIVLVTIVLVGAGQHQLSGQAHEAAHYILFRNRWLNDLAGDWLSMFPLFSALYFYRLQHCAHHQFVNDPERDPDLSQLQTSGHWLGGPCSRKALLLTALRHLRPTNLIRYTIVRAGYNTVGAGRSPYLRSDWVPSHLPSLAETVYIFGLGGLLMALARQPSALLLALVPVLVWGGFVLFLYFLPEQKYYQSRVPPFIPLRYVSIGRTTYFTIIFIILAWIKFTTGRPAAFYFVLLWVLPLFTTFSYFMMLRQNIQHGNADRGRLTNTRVFLVNLFFRFAIFPVHQDYHVPHHLYASIPHYRLKVLHALLMGCREYREQVVVVAGCVLHRRAGRDVTSHSAGTSSPDAPTILDVLGPDYARHSPEIYIDDSVLDAEDVRPRDILHA
jgi:fatty acid desaturase